MTTWELLVFCLLGLLSCLFGLSAGVFLFCVGGLVLADDPVWIVLLRLAFPPLCGVVFVALWVRVEGLSSWAGDGPDV